MQHLFNNIRLFLLAFFLVSLSACGGSSSSDSSDSTDTETPTSSTATLSGVVATGAALQGTVEAVNASGVSSGAVTINADGSYTLTIPEGAPYMLQASSSDLATILYSYAEAAGIANVTSLTTLAMFEAHDNGDLEALFQDWASTAERPTDEEIEEARDVVIANFSTLFQSLASLNEDFFTEEFEADGTGIDAVMDALSINIDLETGVVTVSGENGEIAFDSDIDTSAIAEAFDGEWTLTVTGTVTANNITTDVPSTTVSGVDAPEGGNTAVISNAIENEFEGIEDITFTLVSETSNQIIYDLTGTVNTQVEVEQTGQTVTVTATYDLRYTYTR